MPGVLAQHAEQAAHLGQPGPGGVTDRGEPLGPRVGQPGRGQPGGLRLDRDHRDVVGDHIVQLAGDPGPLAAGQVIGQHPLGELAGGAVAPVLLARAARDRRHHRDRDRRGQQHREHGRLDPGRGQVDEARRSPAPPGRRSPPAPARARRTAPPARRPAAAIRPGPAGRPPAPARPRPRASPARTAAATAGPPPTPPAAAGTGRRSPAGTVASRQNAAISSTVSTLAPVW